MPPNSELTTDVSSTIRAFVVLKLTMRNEAFSGNGVIKRSSAPSLTVLLKLLLIWTEYEPTCSACTLVTIRLELLAPVILVPLKRHWYPSGGRPSATRLKATLPPKIAT